MKIAIYAIAKNETKHIDRFVKACEGADTIVILDTGSTDGTYEMLLQYPVEAHRANLSPFRFDVARNMALDLVPADVDICVSLDLDEIPDPDLFDKLRKQWQPDTGRAWVMWDTGNIWGNNLRVHARHGYRWKYPCHEVTYPLNPPENEIVVESLVTHEPDNDKSRGSYLELLEIGHHEDPDDHRMLVYLIREYYFHKRWQDVIDHVKKLELQTGGWNVELANSYRAAGDAYVALGDKETGLKYLWKNADTAPLDLEAWLPLAHFYYTEQQWQDCYDAAIKVTELSLESRNHYVADSSMPWRLFDLLAIACWNLGKRGSAKKYSRMAYELNPEEQRLKDNYDFIVKQTAKEYRNGLQNGLSDTGL
jgi:glycosyltransferase involved in cell wall biosynthesis